MNKHIKKITLISGCITSLLFSYGCSEELFVDEQNRNEKELIVKERTSTRIEKLSNLPEFNSFLNENIIQNKFSTSAKKSSLDGEKNVFIVEKDGTTSYSTIFYNGNSYNDSGLNDKPRNQGVHWGGTIAETFGWKETIYL